MQTRTATAAALLVLGAPWLSAQQIRPPEFRSGVEVVTIEVGVVDRQGRPVRGLGPADFVATVDGHTRRIVTAEYIDVTAARPGLTPLSDMPVSTNEGGGIGRQFVFIVDQSTLEPGSAHQVARAASRFFSQLTFADRSALMVMPVGTGVGFTYAHDRVRDALQRVSGLSSPATSWEYGSLAEARDISNSNMFALRNVGDRECRGGSISASSGGGAGIPAPGPATPSGAGPAGGPGGAPAGGAGTAAPTGGGGTSTGTTNRNPRGSSAFGFDPCRRDVQMQAESTWRMAQMTSLSSLTALRQMLANLGRVGGDKTVILISGGWPLDDREVTLLMNTLAAEAAAARATLFTLFVPASPFSAGRRTVSTTTSLDQYIYSWPLETLASMTGGGSYRAEVGAEDAFDRLGRELAGYYRIGIERDSTDLDAKNRRLKVQVPRSSVTVRAREIFDVRTYEDRDWAARMASALEAPVPATGLGLRVTSYLAADPEDPSRLKLVFAGEASRLQPGDATFQILVRDLEGKRILSGEKPLGEAIGDKLPFWADIPVSPGTYIVRLAVMDSAGRVGSVDHRVEAQQVSLGSLSATGPLLVRVPAASQGDPRIALDGVRRDERLALQIDLEGSQERLSGTDVDFEIAESSDGPALVHASGTLSAGSRGGSMVAQAVADIRVLPAGRYVARVKVMSGLESLGALRRSFSVIEALRVSPDTPAAAPVVVAARSGVTLPAARMPLSTVPRFTLDEVLAPQVLGGFLDRVAARPDAAAPGIPELLARARTKGLAEVVVPEALAAEAPVAVFVQGLALLAQKKYDPAANVFRSVLRAAPDFYPAMVYLGACYAAGGKDKDAAGAWRTALIKEGDTAGLHVMLTDSLLRQGRGDLALEAVNAARALWPDDDGLKRRFVVAAVLDGKHADAVLVVDELIVKKAVDEPTLALALLVLYDATVNGQPLEGVEQDRARMARFADTYRTNGGPSLALIETWMAAVARKY